MAAQRSGGAPSNSSILESEKGRESGSRNDSDMETVCWQAPMMGSGPFLFPLFLLLHCAPCSLPYSSTKVACSLFIFLFLFLFIFLFLLRLTSCPLSVKETHGREALLLCLFGVSPTRSLCLMWFSISLSPLTSLPGHYDKILNERTMSLLSFS